MVIEVDGNEARDDESVISVKEVIELNEGIRKVGEKEI